MQTPDLIVKANGDGKETRGAIASEALIVSMLTGVAYLIVYAFQAGRDLFYGLPTAYISIDTPKVIAVAVVLLTVIGLPIASALHYRSWDIDMAASFHARTIIFIVTGLIASASLIYIVNIPLDVILKLALTFLVLMIVMTAALLAYAVFKRPANSGVWALVGFARAVEAKRSVRSTALFLAINLTIDALAISAALGYTSARWQAYYPIVQAGRYKGYAVVWMIDPSFMVLQKIDVKSKRLDEDIALIKVEKGSDIDLRVMRVQIDDDVYSVANHHRARKGCHLPVLSSITTCT